uniref:Cystatin domain-containing protein n=1 Tax=Sparus aurata TaxID=8175 RepID=A0A671W5T6_SPAAU
MEDRNTCDNTSLIKTGWGIHTKYADKETQWIYDQVRSLVQGKMNKVYQEYRAVKYMDQTAAGKNFLIKIIYVVHVGGHNYMFVFRDLPCNGGRLELLGVQQHKTKEYIYI